MQDHERKLILDQLNASHRRMLGLVEGLTAEQWTFRPAEGRWSICECLEHVTRVENRVTGLIGKKLQEPPEPEKKHLVAGKDEMIAQRVPDRSNRIEAPEPARPIGQWPDPNELVARIQRHARATTRFAEENDVDLRNYFMTHGAFGNLDCYQWLLRSSSWRQSCTTDRRDKAADLSQKAN